MAFIWVANSYMSRNGAREIGQGVGICRGVRKA